MKIGDFYKYAVEYAQRMRFARPQLAECNAAFVTNENDEVFSCISGITIQDGDVVDVPADTSAYAMMKDAGFDIAKNIAVIRLYDDELLEPSEECMEIMLAVNKNNKNCMVCLGPDKEITLSAAKNIVEDQVVDLTKAPVPEIDDEEYEEKAEEPAAEEAEVSAEEAPAEAEEQPAEEAAPMPDFMIGFDFSADEPAETTPEDEEKALEEKKARQKAAQEAIDKKLAEKAAAEAAKGVSAVKVEENNPFAATSDAVTPVEDTLAVFEDVASGKADSFKPKDEIDARPLISPEELLKQAKRRKKVAKSNFFFRKRM